MSFRTKIGGVRIRPVVMDAFKNIRKIPKTEIMTRGWSLTGTYGLNLKNISGTNIMGKTGNSFLIRRTLGTNKPTGVDAQITLRAEKRPPTTKDLQFGWRNISLRYNWDAFEDPVYWARLIDLTRTEEAKKLGIHPAEVFGENAAHAFYDADRFLKEIPIGQFKLATHLIMEVNRRAVKNIKPFWQRVAKLIPFAKGYILRNGGIFRRRRVYHLYKSHPLREERYQQLMANKAELGVDFWEFPWSIKQREGKPGDRYGILKYPPAGVVEGKLEELILWFNGEREKIIGQRPDAMDPIDLAAQFQIRYVAIHPTLDGNGRTSRLLMNRILREFGLPPSVRISYASDIDLSFEEHARRVREGIAEFIKIVKASKPDEIPNIGNRGFGTKIGRIHPVAIDGLNPSGWEQVFNFTGRDTEFVFSDDGFFYDKYGIPYIYRSGKLWPIADATYRLYAYGGVLNGVTGVQRNPNPEHAKIYTRHLELAQKLTGGKTSPESIDAKPYSTIKGANQKGEHHIYNWQIPLVQFAATIKDDPKTNPFAVLCQNRGNPISPAKSGNTRFEQVWLNGWKRITVSDVIGQYEIQDLFYSNLKRYAETKLPPSTGKRIVTEIMESRRKLHLAGRILLRNFFAKKAELTKADKAYLGRHPEYRGYDIYLKYSKLGYASFADAMEKFGDEYIYLLRAASKKLVKILGYRSEADLRRIFDTLTLGNPEMRKIVIRANRAITEHIKAGEAAGKEILVEDMSSPSNWIATVIANHFSKTAARREVINGLANRILVNPLTYRGIAEEYDRLFVDLLLHASDRPPKRGLSFTTSPRIVFRPVEAIDDKIERLRFVNPMFAGAIFLFEAPRKDVEIQYGSKWRDQYEVYLKTTIGSIESFFATKETIEAKDLKPPEGKPTEAAKAFLENAFYIYLKGFKSNNP